MRNHLVGVFTKAVSVILLAALAVAFVPSAAQARVFFGIGFGGFGFPFYYPYAYYPPAYYPPAYYAPPAYAPAPQYYTPQAYAAPAANAPAPRDCRPFSSSIMIDGRKQQAQGTVCRQPDGSWRTQ